MTEEPELEEGGEEGNEEGNEEDHDELGEFLTF